MFKRRNRLKICGVLMFATLLYSCNEKLSECVAINIEMENLMCHIHRTNDEDNNILFVRELVLPNSFLQKEIDDISSKGFAQLDCGNVLEDELTICNIRFIPLNDINPEISSKNKIITFTSMYQNTDKTIRIVGVTMNCGTDCGSMDLYTLEKNETSRIVTNVKNVGVM